MSRDIRANNEATSDVRERVIRLEERDRRLDEVESSVRVLETRVDVLLRDKDRREGAIGALAAIKGWAPFIAMIASVLAAAWLYGRSAGIVPAPPPTPVRVDSVGGSEPRQSGSIAGGKP